jgi:replicative DNA helicase
LSHDWGEAWYSTEAHKTLATVLRKMSAQGVQIDHVTVWKKLSELGKSTLFGSTKALAQWRDEGIDSDALDSYLEILLEAAQRRQWVQTAYDLLRSARDSKVHVNDIRQKAEQSLLTTANSSNENRLVTMSFAVEELWDRITGNMPPVMYSNIAPFDRAMQGASEGALIGLAGRPGGGKTALAVQYALELALQGQAIILFSQEVARFQIVARLVSCAIQSLSFRKRYPDVISSLAPIPYSRIIKSQMTDIQFAAFSAVSNVLHELPIWIPFGKVGLDQIKSESRSVSEKIGFPVVPIIDYLQYMEWPSGIVKENEAIGRNVYGLKALADTDYCHHAVFLSQMNRGIEGRTGSAARMSDVEGSGKIEQAATDLHVFLPPKEKDDEDTTEQEDDIYTELTVDCIKARNGETGIYSMLYAKAWNYFTDTAYGINSRN